MFHSRELARPAAHRKRLVLSSLLLGLVPVGSVEAQSYAVRGTIVTPAEVITDGSAVVAGANFGRVDASVAPGAVDVDGVIFPGLIDLHNHLTWNLLPRWKPKRLFANRYEWLESVEYTEMLAKPKAALDFGVGVPDNSYSCDMNRYGELKAIVNGATATVGGFSGASEAYNCIAGLARNLDAFSELTSAKPNAEPFRNLIFPLQPSSPCEEQALRDLGEPAVGACEPGWKPKPSPLRAAVGHVAEGVDASARREFVMLEAHGFLVAGFSIVHGVALRPEHFKKMRDAGAGFVWSPRSNFELYGRTADIASAKAEAVVTAIAPDWSPTGSAGMLAELAYAERLRQGAPFDVLTERDLVDMATVNPAKLAGLDARLGRIAQGYAADFIVMRRRPWTGAAAPTADQTAALAHQALLRQTPGDLRLVVVAGVPIFGEPALMAKLLTPQQQRSTEVITLCGESRVINVRAGTYLETPWSVTETRLADALKSLRIPLADLVECSLP
jgi:hypothetical protein